ncbi:hypothetical protein SFR_5408 [Streptomyces sp. FR-008]|nr:hypothetical protein SFR_5408 [Streptomyces sp. FR-008]
MRAPGTAGAVPSVVREGNRRRGRHGRAPLIP